MQLVLDMYTNQFNDVEDETVAPKKITSWDNKLMESNGMKICIPKNKFSNMTFYCFEELPSDKFSSESNRCKKCQASFMKDYNFIKKQELKGKKFTINEIMQQKTKKHELFLKNALMKFVEEDFDKDLKIDRQKDRILVPMLENGKPDQQEYSKILSTLISKKNQCK